MQHTFKEIFVEGMGFTLSDETVERSNNRIPNRFIT